MASVFSKIVKGDIPSYKVAETDSCYAFLDTRAVRAAVPCKRVGVAVLGMEVPHAHIHLVPLDSEGDMDFRKTKLSLSGERFEALAASIAAEYAKL